MKTAIVDIDGTISDSRWRLHFIRPEADGNGKYPKKDYDGFHSRCRGDTVIESVATLVAILAMESNVVLVTGRPNTFRDITMDWLDSHCIPYDELHMRPLGDTRPAPEYKKEVLDNLRAKGHDVFIAIDDQQSVVDMWRANGLHCLHTEVLPHTNS